jgi:hypothetical protein
MNKLLVLKTECIIFVKKDYNIVLKVKVLI